MQFSTTGLECILFFLFLSIFVPYFTLKGSEPTQIIAHKGFHALFFSSLVPYYVAALYL